MKLPTLKNNLYENSRRRAGYGRKVHPDFARLTPHGPRQYLHYSDEHMPSPYGSKLSTYLLGGAPQRGYNKNFRYGRTGYGNKKLKISFGGNSNEYVGTQARSGLLSGLLRRRPRHDVYGLRSVYTDSHPTKNINDPYLYADTDDDIIIHPVITKSSY